MTKAISHTHKHKRTSRQRRPATTSTPAKKYYKAQAAVKKSLRRRLNNAERGQLARLKDALRARGITQLMIAGWAKCKQSNVSHNLNGKRYTESVWHAIPQLLAMSQLAERRGRIGPRQKS